LILFEVFTGRRAYDAKTLVELKQLHDTGTVTTPSSIVRDLDPAVERVILRCLERDPDRRPSSALAIAAALPGGDPLASALAAGETPSPELLVAAGDAARLAIGLTIAEVLGRLLGLHHVATPDVEMRRLMSALIDPTFDGAFVWVFYLAIEPYARRFWPDGGRGSCPAGPVLIT
jgi:hypothetical protein